MRLRARSAAKEKKVMMPGYEQLRDRLVQEGILVEDGEHVQLKKSQLFETHRLRRSPARAPSRQADAP